MTRAIATYISKSLYKKILDEKNKLKKNEQRKIKSRRRIITMAIASDSLAKRL